jgi:hypothetical protein
MAKSVNVSTSIIHRWIISKNSYGYNPRKGLADAEPHLRALWASSRMLQGLCRMVMGTVRESKRPGYNGPPKFEQHHLQYLCLMSFTNRF